MPKGRFSSKPCRRAHPLCAALRDARAAQGRNGREVAATGGLSDTQVYRWERGFAAPSVGNFEAWAGALGFEITLAPIAKTK